MDWRSTKLGENHWNRRNSLTWKVGLKTRRFELDLRIRPPCTGVKHPKLGKRGLQSRKAPDALHPRKDPEKGVSSQQIPFSPVVPCIEMRLFFDSKRPFLGWGELGPVRLRSPLSLTLGVFDPCAGRTDSQNQTYIAVTLHHFYRAISSGVIVCPRSVCEIQRMTVTLHTCFRMY